MTDGASPPTAVPAGRLARRLGLGDAIVIGLGSMIGAGVFAAIGPAARAAGNGLGLGLAAGLAYCNATSRGALVASSRVPSDGRGGARGFAP